MNKSITFKRECSRREKKFIWKQYWRMVENTLKIKIKSMGAGEMA